ncbi:hypothetical protein DIPPA_51309 [Diplonema papillatum]|nr:hypothetical protein DIPPA_51309 [Diplonema papillatum]
MQCQKGPPADGDLTYFCSMTWESSSRVSMSMFNTVSRAQLRPVVAFVSQTHLLVQILHFLLQFPDWQSEFEPHKSPLLPSRHRSFSQYPRQSESLPQSAPSGLRAVHVAKGRVP